MDQIREEVFERNEGRNIMEEKRKTRSFERHHVFLESDERKIKIIAFPPDDKTYEGFTNERFIFQRTTIHRSVHGNNACSTRIIRPLPSSIKGWINFVRYIIHFLE